MALFYIINLTTNFGKLPKFRANVICIKCKSSKLYVLIFNAQNFHFTV